MAAQVDHDPSDVAEEGDGYGGADEGQERLNHSQTDDVISALRTITCNSTAIIHSSDTSQQPPNTTSETGAQINHFTWCLHQTNPLILTAQHESEPHDNQWCGNDLPSEPQNATCRVFDNDWLTRVKSNQLKHIN